MAAQAADTQWLRVQSRNFNLVTDAGDKQGRQVAFQLEQMRNAFGITFNKNSVNRPVPLQVIALRGPEDFKNFLGSNNNAGFYQASEDNDFLVVDASNPVGSVAAYRGFGRALLNANFPRMQPWFDEGFVELFAAMRVEETGTVVGAEPFPGALNQLRASKLSLLELFSAKPGSAGNDRRSPFYLQSWLVVHYIAQQKLMPQLGEYFGLVLNQKVPVDEAVSRAFGVPLPKLEEQIQQHLATLASWNVPTPETISPSTYVVTKLKDVDAQVELADLKLHIPGKEDDTVAQLEQLEDVARNNPDVYAGLGLQQLRSNDLTRAAVNLKRAIDLGSNDPRPYYFMSTLLTRESGGSKWLQIRSLLRKALELDPNYAEGYVLLAFAEASGGDAAEATRWIKQAIALSPRNDRYRLELAKYMIAERRGDPAKALLAFLTNSEDQAVATDAAALLKQIETMGVDQYAAEKRRERENPMTYIDPRWRPKEGGGTLAELEEKKVEEDGKPDTRKIEFMKGRVVKVDCASGNGATITLAAASGKTWTLKTRDRNKLVLIGADKFSCGWSNVRVAVNYKASGANSGDLVSLEVQ